MINLENNKKITDLIELSDDGAALKRLTSTGSPIKAKSSGDDSSWIRSAKRRKASDALLLPPSSNRIFTLV